MAGKPGRSGGARPGAGRKPKPPEVTDENDPLQFLLSVMQGKQEANPAQLKAAIAAAQYVHAKKGQGGKKNAAREAAEGATAGKFAPTAPPRLVHSR